MRRQSRMKQHQRRSTKPVTTAQIVAILSSTLALFFMVAFATKSLDAYRLRRWRDDLRVEIAEMARQRDGLLEQIRRRGSDAWCEEVLRDAGQVSDDLVSVVVVTATPNPMASPMPHPSPTSPPASARSQALFESEHWRAWQRLIWGFD